MVRPHHQTLAMLAVSCRPPRRHILEWRSETGETLRRPATQARLYFTDLPMGISRSPTRPDPLMCRRHPAPRQLSFFLAGAGLTVETSQERAQPVTRPEL